MDEEPWDEGRPNMPGGLPPSPPTRDPPAFLQTKSFTRTFSTGPSPSSSAFNASGQAITLPSPPAAFAEEEDEDSVDEDIGREYDNNRIRQEALRMLEVADDQESSYSVHRTITGGFSAQPRELGSQRGRTALTGLSFVANRASVGKRYADFAVQEAEAPVARDDYEYGDNSVVDVIGMEQRAAETASASSKKNWSSRYSVDKTVLAMSGGTMRKSRRDDSQAERLTSLNLFQNSPTKSTQVFGSGFSFRQKHVFGKQNTTIPTDNLRNLHSNEGPLKPNTQVKTWQEQIQQKRHRQRLLILVVCVMLFAFLVPTASVLGIRKVKHLKSIPADGFKGSVTFSVFGNGPFGSVEDVSAKLDKSADKSSFAVHLGNLQDIETSGCSKDSYTEMASFLEEVSPETLFVVPGHKDWNECADPEAAWSFWTDSFLYFDRFWNALDDDLEKNPFLVYRQNLQRENWAFVHDGVLFLGVHVVNGAIPEQEEFNFRNELNFNWVFGMTKQHDFEIRAVVMFGNGMPGYEQNKEFFGPIEEYWREYDKPALYVHLNNDDIQEDISEAYHPYDDLPHFMATRVKSEDWDEPLLISVGEGKTPFRMN